MIKINKLPGAWTSSISAGLVAAKSLRFGDLRARGSYVYWVELRPHENARAVLVRWSKAGGIEDLTPEPYCVRTKVHEYGGAVFLAGREAVYFVNDQDQDIYRINAGGIERITQAPDLRFADFVEDLSRQRLIAVCEDHGGDKDRPENRLVTISYADQALGDITELKETGVHDFFASPRLSPDDGKLAYLSWDLPHMPWEAAALFVCDVGDDDSFAAPKHIAGGPGANCFQPVWADETTLYYAGEQDGDSKLYVWKNDLSRKIITQDIDRTEFARPLWALGTTSYAVLDDGFIAASYIVQGQVHLGLVDPEAGTLKPLKPTSGRPFSGFEAPAAGEGLLAAVVSQDDQAPAISVYEIKQGALSAPKTIRLSAQFDLETQDIARGAAVTFAGQDGAQIHALYYPPSNKNFSLSQGIKPPAIVSAHGGPTAMADRGLKLKIQYWTSRGFAYLDIDYRGSTGYGKTYRQALDGQWGVMDVADVIAGTHWLVDQGLADLEKLIISGSSAGGYTVLQTLVMSDVFAAGAAYYGISDLEKLAAHTHKFEAGYLDTLLGLTPETADDIFAERSPLHHADNITAPVIFLQGADDKVVPPEQSRLMVESLKSRGIPVAYVEFEGEGHGFRGPESVKQALEAEYAFYNQILNLGSGENLPEIVIENFK